MKKKHSSNWLNKCTNKQPYLEEDKSTEPEHFPLHGAIEVPFLPEVHGGEDVRQSNQPAPHAMAPLHEEDELKLWQSHVVIQSGEKEMETIIKFLLKAPAHV